MIPFRTFLFYLVFLIILSCIISESFSCGKGFFSHSNGECKKLLSCKEMQSELEFVKELDGGYVKKMSLVKWGSMKLVYSVPRTQMYVDDFEHGIKMMEGLQGSRHLLEVVGLCYEPKQILTKYYKHGPANNLPLIIQNAGFNDEMESRIRLQLSSDYLETVDFLHNSPIGCRVMCDSNSVEKTMSQYLISDEFRLILADVDALPEVERSPARLIKCGHRELIGSFVAPEQLWPFKDLKFNDTKMPGYDEKTDIWKIPNVLYFLLGNTITSERIKFMFFNTLKKCKSLKPEDRPTAKQLVTEFKLHRKKVTNKIVDFHSVDEL